MVLNYVVSPYFVDVYDPVSKRQREERRYMAGIAMADNNGKVAFATSLELTGKKEPLFDLLPVLYGIDMATEWRKNLNVFHEMVGSTPGKGEQADGGVFEGTEQLRVQIHNSALMRSDVIGDSLEKALKRAHNPGVSFDACSLLLDMGRLEGDISYRAAREAARLAARDAQLLSQSIENVASGLLDEKAEKVL